MQQSTIICSSNPPVSPHRNRTKRRILAVCFVILVHLAATGAVYAQSVGTKLPVPVRVIVPQDLQVFVVDGHVTQELDLLDVDAEEILAFLRGIVSADVIGLLETAAQDGNFTPAELAAIGIEFLFDTGDLAAQITVPLTLTEEQTIFVKGRPSLPPYRELEPVEFSAALPFWGRFDSATVSSESPLYSSEVTLAPAFVYRDWILEGELLSSRTAGSGSFRVENARVIHDFVDYGLRVSAGQIVYPVRGFQNLQPLFGIAAAPGSFGGDQSASSSRFSQPITVEGDTTANVYINDRLIRSFELEPGLYQLEDFPLAPGMNDIRIELIDRFGEIESITANVPFAGDLLWTGELEYAGAVGFVPWTLNRPMASGYIRRGMSTTVTAGTTLQFGTNIQVLGTEAIYASPYGTVRSDLYGSLYEWQTAGWAGRFYYRFSLSSNRMIPSAAVSVRYQSPGFRVVGQESATEQVKWVNSVSVSQALPWEVGAVAGFTHRSYYGNDLRSAQFFLGLNRSISTFGGIRISGDYDPLATGNSWGVRITATFRTGSNRVNMNTSVDVPDANIDTGVNGSFGTGMIAGTASAGFQNLRLSDGGIGGVNAGAGVDTHRFEASGYTNARYTGSGSISGQEVDLFRYGLRFGSGLYYADRVVGIGRPSRAGFAVVRADKDVPASTVLVNPHGAGADSKSGWMGAAVVTDYSAYQNKVLQAEITGLPADFSLGNTSYIYHPRYRSGTLVTIPGTHRVYVRGTLVDAAGEPVALKGLVIVPLFEPDIDETETPVGGFSFSDELGVFEIYGLVTGTYQILVQGKESVSAVFPISVADERLVEIGEVVVDGFIQEESR